MFPPQEKEADEEGVPPAGSSPQGTSGLREEEEAIRKIMRRYLAVIEDQIRRYPTQWLLFREFAVSSRMEQNGKSEYPGYEKYT